MQNDIDSNFAVEEETPVLPEDGSDEQEEKPSMPPLWKQAAGAVAGALVALALYSVYEAVSPMVTAVVTPTHATHAVSTSAAHVSTSGRKQRTQE